MVLACILIWCEAGKHNKVVGELKKLKGVKKAFAVHGRWDVVSEVEVANLRVLGGLALKINGLEAIRATETLVGFQEG